LENHTTARKPVSAGAEIDFPAEKTKQKNYVLRWTSTSKPANAGRQCFFGDSTIAWWWSISSLKEPKTFGHFHNFSLSHSKSPAICSFFGCYALLHLVTPKFFRIESAHAIQN
jgi:hypothetical protein